MYNLRSAIVLLMVASLRDAFRMQNRIVMHQKSKLGILFVSGDEAAGTDDVEEKESDSDRRERLRAKARKMMFNEKGVPYAPWMVRQIDEEDMIDLLIRKEEGEGKYKRTVRLADGAEMEASGALKWRKAGNLVELSWNTGEESGNQGYVVQKKPTSGAEFMEVATYADNAQLKSRGAGGSRYRFTDPSTEVGSWIYRILDCDEQGTQSVLCQSLVEVETAAEAQKQGLVAIGLLVLLAIAASIGYGLDPPR